MGLPVITPFAAAWNHTVQVLFKPFDIGKWFILGFGAFLATLGEGGGFRGNFFGNGNGDSKPGNISANHVDKLLATAHAWVLEHLVWVMAGGCALVILVIGLGAVFMWLSSRGIFIFQDNLLKNRAEISKPWDEFKKEANSLFKWRLAMFLASMLLVWAPMLWGIWSLLDLYVHLHEFSLDCWFIVIGLTVWMMILLLTLIPCLWVLRDFIPIIQWHRRIPAGDALRIFWHEVLPGNFWSLGLYCLWLMALGIGVAAVIVIGICCTCCLAALPYLSSVVFLPVFALFRLYPAHYLAQLGPAWALPELPKNH